MTTLQLPHQYKSPLDRCTVRIEDSWYDCTAWRHAHPGGAQIVDQFDGKDATDVFHALHSKDALRRLKKMKGRPLESHPSSQTVATHANISASWNEFRLHLEQQGWFQRNYLIELKNATIPFLMIALGVYLCAAHPFLAMGLVGFGMQQAAWISHDYAHMRGTSCVALSHIFAIFNGMSRGWWTNKHNTHHTFPNRMEFDSDIHNEPILHLWFPDADKDVWFRKYQHLFYPFVYAFLMVSWRAQSFYFALSSKNTVERVVSVLSYVWLAVFVPLPVAIGAILVCGFLVAIVVTANHQTEEILPTAAEYNFAHDQFMTTRGVVCGNFFTEYLFGGMQYQLEHHLFPTMPRYKFPALRPLVHQFATRNGLQYHMSGVAEILLMNYKVMRKSAAQRPTTSG